MLIDSHCHLDYEPLYQNLDEVISRANLPGVEYFLTISTTIKSFEKIKLIIDKYDKIFGTIGIHPHETEKHKTLTQDNLIKYFKNNNKIIGIGETGLDFYYNHSDKNTQIKSFVEHIRAAIKLNVPIIVHSRNAEKETYDILKDESLGMNLKILMHCFTGSKEFSKKMLDLGAYISFSGIITFNNSLSLIKTASSVPIDRLLLETDSPYLSPVPNRGKTNEPSYIKYTAEKLSIIMDTDLDIIKKKTSENFFSLFKIN